MYEIDKNELHYVTKVCHTQGKSILMYLQVERTGTLRYHRYTHA